jgi:hypothetical protein
VDVAATVYLIAGLLLLYRLAGRHGVSAQGRLMSLIAIVFGTNLFHYSTYDACFSHVPAFFGVCVWLTALEAYVARPHWARAAAVGAGAGLVLLGRYTNAVLLLLLAAYWLQARKAAPTPAWHLAVAGLAATLVLSPQLLYNRLGSGSWFFQGYAQRGEGFIHWSRPRFGEVLTSDEHGILLYCPILMPALVEASLRVWHGQDRWLFASVLGVAAIQAYILASWWWPGLGGFSQRGFAEYQALAYLPLALAYDRVRRGPARAAARPGVVLCCLYTTCLMLRYWWF